MPDVFPSHEQLNGTASTLATTGTISVPIKAIHTITPTGACTFNATGGMIGQQTTFAITTAGASSFVLTWGQNFKPAGTLATGTVAGKSFAVTFKCINGTTWWEVCRTGAM